MAKNIFAFIGLWVVIAATQDLCRKCQRGFEPKRVPL